MDRKITARFYQVENIRNGEPTFYECLENLWHHPDRSAYCSSTGGIMVRIERLSRGDGQYRLLEGEFVRQQTENIPPVAPEGVPLVPQVEPLGHRAAFIYWPARRVFLMETRRGSVSLGAVNGLIKNRVNNHKGFFFDPALTSNALERLREGTPRRIQFRVARPMDIAAVENSDLDLEENLGRLQNMFAGPNIEVAVSWPRGNRDGALSFSALRRLVRWGVAHRANVEKMSVKILEEEEPIDLLSDQLKSSETLELDSEDIEANFITRRDFIRRSFLDRVAHLEQVFGE